MEKEKNKIKTHEGLAKSLCYENDPYKIIEKELGPAVRGYRRNWERAGKRAVLFKYPLHLNLELTYGCNLRCQFCLLSSPALKESYKARPTDKISFKKYCQIIDEGVKNGLCSVALNGINEPLLQGDIVKYINYARKSGILDVTLHTNGLLLTKKLSLGLINSGLTIIMFSIDAATEGTYKKIRRNNGFNRLVKNVSSFIKLKKKLKRTLPLTRVSFVENKLNHLELKNFVSFWEKKVDFFAIQSFYNPFVGQKHHKAIEDEFRFKDTPFGICTEPYRRLMITCDGNVLPCCSYYGLNLVVGNINKDSVYNIWNSPAMSELRKKLNKTGQDQPLACRKCREAVIS